MPAGKWQRISGGSGSWKPRAALLGASDREIAALNQAEQVDPNFSVPAPINGVILTRTANLGLVVNSAQELFTVADLSTVWVMAVIRLMVRILKPQPGLSIYDPTCGSGGMLIISREYIEQSGGDPTNLRLCGQVNDASAWSICKLNMLLHGLPGADIQLQDTLLHPVWSKNSSSVAPPTKNSLLGGL